MASKTVPNDMGVWIFFTTRTVRDNLLTRYFGRENGSFRSTTAPLNT